MLMTFATLAALTLAPPPLPPQQGETDTTVAVPAGARLDVNNYGGEIIVRTWNRNNVRVHATHSRRDRVQVSLQQSTVLVRMSGRLGPSSLVDLEITVPQWMGATLEGVYTDITVENLGGPLSAESVQGEISVTGGVGNISLKSVEGGVTLTKARGRMELNTVEGDVRVTDAVGELSVETVDGTVELVRIESSSVEVNTVDGDITYNGTIKDGGSYRLASHDGDLSMAIPEGTNAAVSVASFDGDFDSCFPVEVNHTGKHRFSFTIGSGKARIELETFDGDVKLCRPGQMNESDRNKHKNKDRNHNDEP